MSTVFLCNTSKNTARNSSVKMRQMPRYSRTRQRHKYLMLRLLSTLLLAELALCAGFLMGRASISLPELWIPAAQNAGLSTNSDSQEADAGKSVIQESFNQKWNLLLINKDSPLPDDFIVPELTQLRNGHAVDARVYPSLQAMMDACREYGLDPLICSAFRTFGRQEELYSNKVNSLLAQGYSLDSAETEAAVWVARPGTSEHQAGLAVDIVDTSYQRLDIEQEYTPVQQWLMEHCAEYGFILRYPTDKSDITGIGYEPWHYRYVGTEAAQYIMEKGICLEEYLGQQN